jgi:hypothetical protein
MSQLTKSESARINGAKSRGAVTPQGRLNSSRNAANHGLTARTLILQNEDKAQFLEILNAYYEYLQPRNQIEVDLVSDIVAARWRLRRIWRYETAILDMEMDVQSEGFEKRFEVFDEDMRGGLAFSTSVDKSKGLSTVLRYDIHLSRIYRKALEELRLFRRLRNDPTEPRKSTLNGENRLLNGEQEGREPTVDPAPTGVS